MKVHLGDVVHYSGGGACTAALVTLVLDEERVYLTLFPPNVIPYPHPSAVTRGEGGNTWHWPDHANGWHWPAPHGGTP